MRYQTFADFHKSLSVYPSTASSFLSQRTYTSVWLISAIRGQTVSYGLTPYCINQWDPNERSLQVQRLGTIYSKARSVIVFLRPEQDSSSDALFLLEQLGGIVLGDHDGIRKLLEEASRASSWQALLQLFARPWWTRAWIVQEYVVGAEATILCGHGKLPGHLFGKAMENLVDYRFKATVAKETREPHQTCGQDLDLPLMVSSLWSPR
jgi:hypothetical protein